MIKEQLEEEGVPSVLVDEPLLEATKGRSGIGTSHKELMLSRDLQVRSGKKPGPRYWGFASRGVTRQALEFVDRR